MAVFVSIFGKIKSKAISLLNYEIKYTIRHKTQMEFVLKYDLGAPPLFLFSVENVCIENNAPGVYIFKDFNIENIDYIS